MSVPALRREPVPLLIVRDDVLPSPDHYRTWALTQPFQTHETGDEHWHGVALLADQTLPALMASILPGAQTHLTFFRRSPLGQAEPNFIHSDEGMGQWTAILYLNPTPAEGDGTTFWRFLPSDEIYGSARALDKTPALWEPWRRVEARFNRLLIFDSLYFHSRAIEDNYGEGDNARLIQVAFGTWAAPTVTPGWQIRDATLEDVPALVAMGRRFRAESVYADRIPENTAQMGALATRLITEDLGHVLVLERDGVIVGTIGLLCCPNHLSGVLTVGELFFWVNPEQRGYGVRLLRRAEQWARARGATEMHMIAPTEDVEQFYTRLGYRRWEVVYVKELSPCL